jgi:hypothetical protein
MDILPPTASEMQPDNMPLRVLDIDAEKQTIFLPEDDTALQTAVVTAVENAARLDQSGLFRATYPELPSEAPLKAVSQVGIMEVNVTAALLGLRCLEQTKKDLSEQAHLPVYETVAAAQRYNGTLPGQPSSAALPEISSSLTEDEEDMNALKEDIASLLGALGRLGVRTDAALVTA